MDASYTSDLQRGLPLVIRRGEGRTEVCLELRAQGRDLVLAVTGGQAHVGAVALASPGDREARLAVIPPHKEGPLAASVALRVTRAAGCACAVTAGIHQEAITPDEIAAVVAHVGSAVEELAGHMEAAGGWRP